MTWIIYNDIASRRTDLDAGLLGALLNLIPWSENHDRIA